MVDTKQNALAELADRLDVMAFFASRRIDREDENILRKAQRIVAELAKVKLNGVGWPGRIELASAYEECRVIAEGSEK